MDPVEPKHDKLSYMTNKQCEFRLFYESRPYKIIYEFWELDLD